MYGCETIPKLRKWKKKLKKKYRFSRPKRKHYYKLPEGLPVSPGTPKTIPALEPTGTARDTRAPTGYVPTTISSFTYIPK
jgi:hypothetical protein